MKISLINPPWYTEKNPMLWGVRAGSRWPHFQKRPAADQLPRYIPFPFFMAIAARVLTDAGHDVQLIDAVAEGIKLEDVQSLTNLFEPELIFVEMTTPSLSNDQASVQSLRETCPQAKFIGGGLLDRRLAHEQVKQGYLDYWLTGEYDQSLRALVGCLETNQPLDEVDGLIDITGRENPPANIANLDDLPVPLHEQLPMTGYCDPVCGLPHPSLQTWLSRGCPYGCTFCVWPQLIYGNRRYRTRSNDRALDEVEQLVELYELESFYFDDDTTNIGEARMLDLAKQIRERGLNQLPWGMMARGDCMSRAMIDAFAEAGMYSVKYGVESISTKLTDACGKGTKLDKLTDAIAYTKEAGIKVHLTFTFGLPGETTETIRETIDFAIEAAPETAQFSICTPFPGTTFYDDCLRQGHLITTDWQRFLGSSRAVVDTPELPARELEAGYREGIQRWREFTDARMQSRRQQLLLKLKDQVASGATWNLLGDEEMIDFLNTEPSITTGRVDKDGDVRVIASRHDEEKIWRKLPKNERSRALRLYG